MTSVVIDQSALDEWAESGSVRDYADSSLRTLYRVLLAQEEHHGWLPEPDATMLRCMGAELSRRALLCRD